jgi:uncharacterized protein YcfL
MKKYFLIFAVSTSLVLTACGSGSATNEVKDSTNTEVDTTAVVVDSTSVVAPVGGGGDLPTKPTENVK